MENSKYPSFACNPFSTLDIYPCWIDTYVYMSPTASSRTLRFRGLKSNTCAAELLDIVQTSTDSKRRSLTYRLLPPKEKSNAERPECFLAQQGDLSTGTITFGSADDKTKAAKRLLGADEWDCDDKFDGLTVLKAGENVNLE